LGKPKHELQTNSVYTGPLFIKILKPNYTLSSGS